jgi:hypothetical protein
VKRRLPGPAAICKNEASLWLASGLRSRRPFGVRPSAARASSRSRALLRYGSFTRRCCSARWRLPTRSPKARPLAADFASATPRFPCRQPSPWALTPVRARQALPERRHQRHVLRGEHQCPALINDREDSAHSAAKPKVYARSPKPKQAPTISPSRSNSVRPRRAATARWGQKGKQDLIYRLFQLHCRSRPKLFHHLAFQLERYRQTSRNEFQRR